MKIKFPDYTNCLVNVANTILDEFGAGEGKQKMNLLDGYLKKDYENIVIILLDGMGECIIRENLEKNGFFNSNLKGIYSSVFPPATVAATTSILSGLQPCEHGWLGWECYYPQIDKNVTIYLNKESGTDNQAADYNVACTYCGYKGIVSKIRGNGGIAFEAAPFAEPYPDSFEKICGYIKDLCRQEGKKYIYSYWNEPDGIMHRKGCYGNDAKQMLLSLERQVEKLCNELENTLVIVTADHGHMDSKGVSITDYPGIIDCLVRMPSIEPRALNLFVKEKKVHQFEYEFKKEFGDKFLLWTKQKVIESNLFGTGSKHPCFDGMIGNYLAIATDDLSIYNTREEADYYSRAHAGMTADEKDIPLIIIENR